MMPHPFCRTGKYLKKSGWIREAQVVSGPGGDDDHCRMRYWQTYIKMTTTRTMSKTFFHFGNDDDDEG